MSRTVTVAQLLRAAADLALHEESYDTCILIRHMLTWHIGEPSEQAAPYKSAGIEPDKLRQWIKDVGMLTGPFDVIPAGDYENTFPNELKITQLIYARDQLQELREINAAEWLSGFIRNRQREIEAEENRKMKMTRNRGTYRNNWKRH